MVQADELFVPEKQAVRVEYPGYIEDQAAALSTLGNASGLQRAAQPSNTHLPLRFRPEDRFCRPIHGEKCSVKGLLVEVSKDESQTLTVQAVAKVNGSYRFSVLSDFQYVADDSLEPHTCQVQDDSLAPPPPEPLLAVPPLFARSEESINYQYCSFYGMDPPLLKAQGIGKMKGQLPPHVLKFVSLKIPPKVNDSSFVMAHYNPANWEILCNLRELFSKRPIWSALALKERIPVAKSAIDPFLLAKVAYIFRSGPFASLWVARGHDPRADAESRQYQALTYAIPESWASSLKQQKLPADDGNGIDAPDTELPPLSNTYSDVSRFLALPEQEMALQLCDLQDLHISRMVSEGSAAAMTCSKATGWYSQDQFNKIASRVRSRFEALWTKSAITDDPAPVDNEQAAANITSEEHEQANIPNTGTEKHATPLQHAVSLSKGEDNIVPQDMINGLLANWSLTQSGSLPTDDNPEGMLPKVSHVGIDDGEDEEFEILEADSEEENDPDVDESGDEGENHMTGMEFDMLDDMDEDDEE